MLFEQQLRQARRHHRIKTILKKLEGQRSDIKKAFQIAYDRRKDEINIRRLLVALERILDRKLGNNTLDMEGFVDRASQDGGVKSFSDTIRDLEARSRRRASSILDRFREGVDTASRFARNIRDEADRVAATGSLLGSIGSALGNNFAQSLQDTLQRGRERARGILGRIRDNVNNNIENITEATVTNLSRDLFANASQTAREDRPVDDELFSDLTDREMDSLLRPRENYDELIARFGHVKVERRVEIKDDSICPECIQFAAMGWQLRGVLPNIGERSRCRQNCRCRFFTKNLRDIPARDAFPILRDIRHRASLARE